MRNAPVTRWSHGQVPRDDALACGKDTERELQIFQKAQKIKTEKLSAKQQTKRRQRKLKTAKFDIYF